MVGEPEKRPLPVIRNRYFLLADLALLTLSVLVSAVVRLGGRQALQLQGSLFLVAALATAVKLAAFFAFGIHRRHWRYASIGEFSLLVGAVAVGELGLLCILLVAPLLPLARGELLALLFIDLLLSSALSGGIRLVPRLIIERPIKKLLRGNGRPGKSRRRVLVMGAGSAGALMIREMLSNSREAFAPVGLLDDDRAKAGMMIHGVPVLGTRHDIPRLAQKRVMDEVIITMPSAPGAAIREIVAICQQSNIPYRTMPGLHELISGRVSVKQVREVRIEDLLRRDPIRFSPGELRPYLDGEVVLITGAGGSIGSELCRQICPQRPATLLLLGHGENSIYQITGELSTTYPQLSIVPLIADIRDHDRLRQIFEAYHPTIVFHAAAHKHVPLMETNAPEAVMNNVFGTRTLVAVSEQYAVKRFVLVSSDKAVNPSTVMGATKRIAELLVQAAAERSHRAFVAVRFGNVLGSRGSVVPLFQKQIAEGGPVTVTHPDMRRYFMTIPEAAHLIIQAGALGSGGQVFVLDMGEPVNIADLAADLIRLSGLEPGRDIEIRFTEPRTAEKLDELLFRPGEEIGLTDDPKIFVAHAKDPLDAQALAIDLEKLRTLAGAGEPLAVIEQMQRIIPEYQPTQDSALDPTL